MANRPRSNSTHPGTLPDTVTWPPGLLCCTVLGDCFPVVPGLWLLLVPWDRAVVTQLLKGRPTATDYQREQGCHCYFRAYWPSEVSMFPLLNITEVRSFPCEARSQFHCSWEGCFLANILSTCCSVAAV